MLLKALLFCLTFITIPLHAADILHPANDIPMENRLYVMCNDGVRIINTENNTVWEILFLCKIIHSLLSLAENRYALAKQNLHAM